MARRNGILTPCPPKKARHFTLAPVGHGPGPVPLGKKRRLAGKEAEEVRKRRKRKLRWRQETEGGRKGNMDIFPTCSHVLRLLNFQNQT